MNVLFPALFGQKLIRQYKAMSVKEYQFNSACPDLENFNILMRAGKIHESDDLKNDSVCIYIYLYI